MYVIAIKVAVVAADVAGAVKKIRKQNKKSVEREKPFDAFCIKKLAIIRFLAYNKMIELVKKSKMQVIP